MQDPTDPAGDPSAIDLADYLPYIVHRLGAWMSPRRALRLADGRTVRLREWRLLLVIAAHDRLTGSDVSYLAAMDSGATTRAVQQLLDYGFIRSDPCEQDRRRSWLALTDAGRAVHAELAARRAAFNRALLAGFTATERERLFAQLAALQERAETLAIE